MAINSYQAKFNVPKYSLIFLIILAMMAIIIFVRRDTIAYFWLLLPAMCMLFFGFYYLDKQKAQRINDLFARGQLIKDVAYQREEFVDLTDIQALLALLRQSKERMSYSVKVNLPLDDNQVITLRTDKGYAPEFLDSHPSVDVLLDPDDYNNYYLDFGLEQSTPTTPNPSTEQNSPAAPESNTEQSASE